jgi:hypothetical protein
MTIRVRGKVKRTLTILKRRGPPRNTETGVVKKGLEKCLDNHQEFLTVQERP